MQQQWYFPPEYLASLPKTVRVFHKICENATDKLMKEYEPYSVEYYSALTHLILKFCKKLKTDKRREFCNYLIENEKYYPNPLTRTIILISNMGFCIK
tara:strand:+ start:3806 stop:4099 length:294 start_codon:yes stop_codon:yes gene_type:complete